MKSLIIIDTSYLFFQLVFAMPDLSTSDQETHIIFGFIRKVLSLSKTFNTSNFVFVFDSKHSKRKEMFPDYKKKRNDKTKEKTPQEQAMFKLAFEQFNHLKTDVLPSLGFKNIFEDKGYESDDIIGDLCFAYGGQCEIVVVSTDEDYFQLLDNCSMYNMKEKTFYTKSDFVKEYGIVPDQWVLVKSHGGCLSDGVPSVTGGYPVGSALKYVKGELPSHWKIYKQFTSEEGKAIFDRNFPLVSLPLDGVKEFDIDFKENFLYSAFTEMCEKYEFRSLMKDDTLKLWCDNFVKNK